jgi:hypothetical protein
MNEITIRESRRLGVEFLFLELDSGMTFVDVARTTRNPKWAEKCQENARSAHDSACKFLPTVKPSPQELQAIREKIRALRAGLESLGESFGENRASSASR